MLDILNPSLTSADEVLVLAFLSTYSFGPKDFFSAVYPHLTTTIFDSQLLSGVFLGVASCLLILAVWSAIRGVLHGRISRDRDLLAEYDPASPTFVPESKWTV